MEGRWREEGGRKRKAIIVRKLNVEWDCEGLRWHWRNVSVTRNPNVEYQSPAKKITSFSDALKTKCGIPNIKSIQMKAALKLSD